MLMEPLSSSLSADAVIFLDCDGVLNSSRCVKLDFDEENDADSSSLVFHKQLFPDSSTALLVPLEKQLLFNLASIIAQVPCVKIVLSTTWREDVEMRHFLLSAMSVSGIDVESVVIGDTPSLSPIEGRGGEIRKWLDDHPDFQKGFVILDDQHEASFAKNKFLPNFVQTILLDPGGVTSNEGLTSEVAAKVVASLKQQLGIF